MEKQDFKNVLEPSAGDGRFLSALLPECNKLKAIELFDKVLDDSSNINTEVFWKTKNQKMLFYVPLAVDLKDGGVYNYYVQ